MTNYLVTGANRGIGRGLADIILSRPNNTLIALVRDPEDDTAKSLSSNEKGANGTKVLIFKYEASDHGAAETIVKSLQQNHGITYLDVVVANAGYMDWRGPTATVTPEAIHKHLDVNTIAPILLFSTCLPLLKQSQKEPKFFAISSAIGSIEWIPKLHHAQVAAYGMSKAAMNWAFVKLNLENPEIDVEMLTPGPVRTGLMRPFMRNMTKEQMEEAAKRIPNMVDYNDSVNGLMKCIDNASKKTTGGGFRQWDGSAVPW